jgi:hypothetical protein
MQLTLSGPEVAALPAAEAVVGAVGVPAAEAVVGAVEAVLAGS